jgi:hypothetical protein
MVDKLFAMGDVYDTGGDVIIAANGKRVVNRSELERELARVASGETINLTVIRRVKSWHCREIKFAMRTGELKVSKLAHARDRGRSASCSGPTPFEIFPGVDFIGCSNLVEVPSLRRIKIGLGPDL